MSLFPNPTQPTKTVKFVGLDITFNAFLTLVAGLILSVVLVFTIPTYGIFAGLYILLLFSLLAYNVNCVQVGHCYLWAWILTVVYLVYAGIVVGILFTKKDVLVEKIGTKIGKSVASAKK